LLRKGILPIPKQKETTVGKIISETTVIYKCLSTLNVKNFRCPYSDHGAKKLLSGQTIALLVEAQLKKRESLEDIAENLRSKKQLREFLDLDAVHASTIYRKLGKLPTEYLKQLYYQIAEKITGHHCNTSVLPDIGPLHIIDSTEISLPSRSKWAYASSTKNGIKVHTRYSLINENVGYVDRIISSTAAVSDQEAAIHLVLSKYSTYVFDRGYINYTHYFDWVKKDILFVARVKANSKFRILSKQEIPDQSNILLDADVMVAIPHSDSTFLLRLVEYVDEKNRKYRVVTNRWDLKATDVAEIYRLRWKIELFFKWIKQHLKAIKWFNNNPEAVWNQIYIIMIAYALCEWIKILTNTTKTTWELLKLLRHNWLGTWEEFCRDILGRPPSRPSKGRKKKGKPGRPRKHPKTYKAVKIINI
jgi:hypothetical protein